ncbi:NAD(P)-dependent oxidoreductase [Streptomyces sp. PU-14G]|uniref:NAD(P)-dependent oxidoreductase n=1 Tax=Streptomyces sp. PU-14G TaxID=2800808 RepID=UPI0034DF0670
MHLTVFGATGGVGREIVRQALQSGHTVTAVVRDPARLPVTGERLEVHTADLTDPAPLSPAVTGRDAVLSGLGASSNEQARQGVSARVTDVVLRALEADGTRPDGGRPRFVAVSAAPLADEPADQTFVSRRIAMPLVSRFLKPVYDDLRVMEEAIHRSATEWTVVRPPMLRDTPLKGTYRTAHEVNMRGGRAIGRADVAHAMLALAADPAAVRQNVSVAY